MKKNPFRTELGENIFRNKYSQGPNDSWPNLAIRLVDDVAGTMGGTLHPIMSVSERDQLVQYITDMKFIPGGRYLYYSGRPVHAWNNCFLLRAEFDTREEWANVMWRATSCLMLGGGIGVDYSRIRPSGRSLSRTGGISSGPLSLINMVNETGRFVQQGGSRRSAIYASLNHKHEDIWDFLKVKNWENYPVAGTNLAEVKKDHFNFPAPLDMTNISVNYDNSNLIHRSGTGSILEFDHTNKVFQENCKQAMMTGEPGFSFNFGAKENETLRNACVPGDTLILTNKGYVRIDETVDKPTVVWNGETWSTVTPFSTGTNTLVRVNLTDGSSLVCTPYHKFILSDQTRVCADELDIGDKLEKAFYPCITNGETYSTDGYSQGFYSGDGNTGLTHSWIYWPKESVIPRLSGTFLPKDMKNDRTTWKHGPMLEKAFVPINGNITYRMNWLAGLIDADGTVTNDINGNGIQICSVDKNFLLNVKLLLTTLGCGTKIISSDNAGYRNMPDGIGGKKEYLCKETYRLLIGNTDTYNLIKLGLTCNRVDLHSNPPQRDARRFVRVSSVETLEERVETFCFNEPILHKGVFNGILTGNCTEVTSEDDSDVCNLGSINLGNIDSLDEFKSVVSLASKFLVCGTIRADLPYDKVKQVREKNRRLGLGLMGIHEWLLKKGSKYEVTPELHQWLQVYKDESEQSANEHCDRLYLSRPVAYRAIAPTGTIGILAGTTTGIEPLFAVAYKRRYLTEGTKWKYEYVIDHTADLLIKETGVSPDKIDTAYNMAGDYERRIKFQFDVQSYVDMSISSTLNLPAWGSKDNNEDIVDKFTKILAKYAPGLRGMTCYPDGSRGGQPITEVEYDEALKHKNVIYEENDACAGGVCGV